MLAQASLDSIPATWLKYAVLTLVVVIILSAMVAGVILAGLQYFQSKRAAAEPQTRTLHPSPVKIENVERPAAESDCFRRHNEVLEEIRELKTERKEDVGELHEKINSVSNDVSGLKVATQLQNQTLAQISHKLDRIAERQ